MCNPRPSVLVLNPNFALPVNLAIQRCQVANLALRNGLVCPGLHLLASVVQGERRAELARDLLSRSPHSHHILYVMQRYKFFLNCARKMAIIFQETLNHPVSQFPSFPLLTFAFQTFSKRLIYYYIYYNIYNNKKII